MGTMMPIEDRFMGHVDKAENGCWQWNGYLYHGYGKFRVDDRLLATHRFSYEFFVGEIPRGLQIDHACHNKDTECTDGDACLHRSCVNPRHLEPVTGGENKLRSPQWLGNKVTCKRGHLFSPVRARHNGQRQCLECKIINQRERRHASAR